jgi:hypothetical protein
VIYLIEVLDRFKHNNGHLLRIKTDNASLKYLMTWELQSTLHAPGIVWPAMRNHMPCMAHIIQLLLGARMCSFVVKGHNKSSEADQRDQQFEDNESTDIGKNNRHREERNTRINKVLAMQPDLAK